MSGCNMAEHDIPHNEPALSCSPSCTGRKHPLASHVQELAGHEKLTVSNAIDARTCHAKMSHTVHVVMTGEQVFCPAMHMLVSTQPPKTLI